MKDCTNICHSLTCYTITWGNPIRFADSVHTNTNPRPDFEFTHSRPPIRRSVDTVGSSAR